MEIRQFADNFTEFPAIFSTKCENKLQLISPVFVGNKESAFNVASIWVLSLFVEHLHVMIEVIQIDGTVEGKHDDLGDLV